MDKVKCNNELTVTWPPPPPGPPPKEDPDPRELKPYLHASINSDTKGRTLNFYYFDYRGVIERIKERRCCM
jgi:hypothetical protein